MTEEPKQTYGVESSSHGAPFTGKDASSALPPGAPESSDSPQPSGDAGTDAPRAGRPIDSTSPRQTVPLEPSPPGDDQAPMALRSVRELDVCPNCGANMPGGDTVVCLRCGFDLKTMKQVKTAVGQVEVGRGGEVGNDGGSGVDVRKPLVVDGWGGAMIPLIAAGVAGAILLLGFLAGIGGLFPPVVNAEGHIIPGGEIGFDMRLTGLLRLLIATAVWTGCGIAALALLAYLNGMRLGDVRLAAARMLGIVAVANLARYLSFDTMWIEWALESIAQAAIFGSLSMVLFNLKPKDVPLLVGATIVMFLALWVSAWAIVWGAA